MNELKIGWAARDISTEKPINIPGQFHMRISEGVMDPLTVSALVIDNGSDLVIFLSADLVVIRSGLLDEIRDKVAESNPEIPVAKILMNATHAHTGASHYADSIWSTSSNSLANMYAETPHDGIEIASSDEYRHFLAGQAAEAVCEAYAKRGAGGIAYGYGYAVVGHSRRVVYFDDTSKRPGAESNSRSGARGHAVMYGNTNDPNFSHYEAGADHFINLLYTFDRTGKLTGAVINVPCPSQNSEQEYRLSADYWHDVRSAIRARHGNIFILPQCAAAGDLSPRILHYKKAQARRFRLKYGPEEKLALAERKDIAERVATSFDEVLGWAKQEIQTALPLAHRVETVQLSRRLITEEEYEYAKNGLEELKREKFRTDGTPKERLKANSILAASRNRFAQVIERHETQAAEPKLPMELHVLRIGEVAFTSNRFELYMDFQHRIQARSPFEQTFIVQLAGQPGAGGGSYLCTERGAWGKGYSASMFCNLVSPQGGQELVEETVRRLEALHSEPASEKA
ncbi:MAG TPA: hypothetical protein PKN80_04765 [bacterium]|uniref:Neutral/alkaline non-lysosomal ceramidase n=1 Tax=candidate division TA06 bacterium ADurb.Bin417 TaxID=1852828 RepID=A0A1V5MHU9_UNCT6|nr:MAG: hypothetical protein BWY73_00635 [candidate division TA06 bacterium ADurb.Bin417]HNQ35360.1 hypothetical protein [bacterium]HNS48827.1 hypothetical protein [bacterium]